MSTVITATPTPLRQGSSNLGPASAPFAGFTTLARRRFSLSAHTPREILVPLLTPILFAAVIAPALAKAMTTGGPIDYLSFVAVGTIGLLVPLSCVLGGIAMIVDRESGAQRDLLAAPIPRSSMVFGNLSVSVVVSSFQVAALMVVAVLRGATFSAGTSGIAWMVAATLGIAVAMHSFAEILAARIPKQEEYVGIAPAAALVPWFFAGSFFPISAMPAGLTVFAKILPLTHALRARRSQRPRAARHLGHEQRHHDGRAQPRRGRRLRRSDARPLGPSVHPRRDPLTFPRPALLVRHRH